MEIAIFLISLFGFMVIGIPIAFVLIMCAIVLMVYMLGGSADPMLIGQNILQGSNSFPLMAIPFFVLAGEIMSKGGLSFRIVQFSKLIIGRVRGGLGYAAVLASIVFAGLSGSAIADAAAIGGLLVPLMIANGYNKARATAFVCSGAIIAPIIPPSIAFVLIGSMTGLSISKLFMVGIVPGVYIGLALMVTWFFIVRKDNYHDVIKFSLKESLIILKESIPALILPMIIIGGVRFGMFTPTEAGAFAVVYALVISVFWYKEFKITDVRRVFVDTAITTAAVMLIVGAATAVGYFMTMAQLPAKISDLFGGLTYNPILFLLASMLFLLTMGMVMDATPNNLIFAPILIPIAIRAGINPYYYALLINLNLNIGLLTPPVGTILYIGAGIGGVPVTEIIKNILPFLFVEMLVLLIFIFFPQVVMIPFEFLT